MEENDVSVRRGGCRSVNIAFMHLRSIFIQGVRVVVASTWPATLLGLDKSVGMAVNYISAPLACQYTTRLRCAFYIHASLQGFATRALPPLSLSLFLSRVFRLLVRAFSPASPLFFSFFFHLAIQAEKRRTPFPPWPPLRKYGPVITLAQGNYQLPGCRAEFYPIRGLLRPPPSSPLSA